MNTFFESENIELRAMEPEDLDLLYEIENDTTHWNVCSTSSPYSKFALKQYIADNVNDLFESKQLRLVVHSKPEKKAVGLIDLFNFSPIDSRAEIGIAVRSEFRNRGYATEALRLLENFASRRLRIRLLYASVAGEDNSASKHLFTSSGYNEVATLPSWHYSGRKYEDVNILCKFFSK